MVRKFNKSYVLDKINRQLQLVQGEMSSKQQDTGIGSLERPGLEVPLGNHQNGDDV